MIVSPQYDVGRQVLSRVYRTFSSLRRSRTGMAGTIEPLDHRDEEGCWQEVLVEHRTCTPADLAASRIDFLAWLGSLSARDQKIAKLLASGCGTSEVAAKVGLSWARISQMRRELMASWEEFHEPREERRWRGVWRPGQRGVTRRSPGCRTPGATDGTVRSDWPDGSRCRQRPARGSEFLSVPAADVADRTGLEFRVNFDCSRDLCRAAQITGTGRRGCHARPVCVEVPLSAGSVAGAPFHSGEHAFADVLIGRSNSKR